MDITKNRHYDRMVFLDETYEAEETPAGFVNLTLYQHQKTILAALIRLENNRSMPLRDTWGISKITSKPATIHSSAIVLSEAFGSGKTFEIIALILASPIPRAYSHLMNSTVLGTKKITSELTFTHEMRRRISGPNALLRSTLIVVSRSVVIQWVNAIEQHTNLRVLQVSDRSTVDAMYKIYKLGRLNQFDIIVVKNGNVSSTFRLDCEADEKLPDVRSIVSVIAKMTAGQSFARVVIDDFDTSNIPATTPIINALSTIYVSATTKNSRSKRRPVPIDTIDELIAATTPRYSNVLNDRLLFSCYNIRNCSKYVKRSTTIPITVVRRCVYKNPNDKYMAALGAMGAEDADRVMEMLNGDAIGEAASTMGIKTSSVVDIFQKMLDTKYDRYVKDTRALKVVEEALKLVAGLSSAPIINPVTGRPHVTHTANMLDNVSRRLKKGKHLESDDIGGYTSTALQMRLEEIRAEVSESKERSGSAITRVISNIGDNNSCQVCLLGFEDGIFISKCCGAVTCGVCGIDAWRISSGYDYRTKQQTLIGACCQCRKAIYPQNDLIFISPDFNIDSLLADKTFDAEIVSRVVEEKEDSNDEEKVSPKLAALLDIIHGRTPENAEVIPNKITSLMVGNTDRGITPAKKRKTVVFAGFAEPVNNIQNHLMQNKVGVIKLEGTSKQLYSLVNEFRDGDASALLVNSSQHCAGINLQFASDMVFFHKILDPNIESQVAGRLIRIGREYNANIWYLCYENEKALVA